VPRTRKQLDRADVELLKAVQKDCRLTSDQLSRIARLSPTACQRRLHRLRKEQVIQAEVAVIAPGKVGRPISVLVFVSMERDRADIVDRFKDSIRKTAEISCAFYVTGDADFIMLVTARSMKDYDDFSRAFFSKNSDIRAVRTYVVMDRVKIGFSVPVTVQDGALADQD
jgi:Lrp/AsnC family transcriptional regulator, leucine-responsive regulatory protein